MSELFAHFESSFFKWNDHLPKWKCNPCNQCNFLTLVQTSDDPSQEVRFGDGLLQLSQGDLHFFSLHLATVASCSSCWLWNNRILNPLSTDLLLLCYCFTIAYWCFTTDRRIPPPLYLLNLTWHLFLVCASYTKVGHQQMCQWWPCSDVSDVTCECSWPYRSKSLGRSVTWGTTVTVFSWSTEAVPRIFGTPAYGTVRATMDGATFESSNTYVSSIYAQKNFRYPLMWTPTDCARVGKFFVIWQPTTE